METRWPAYAETPQIYHLLEGEARDWHFSQYWSRGATWDQFARTFLEQFPGPLETELDKAVGSSFSIPTLPPTEDGSPDTTTIQDSEQERKTILERQLDEMRCTPSPPP